MARAATGGGRAVMARWLALVLLCACDGGERTGADGGQPGTGGNRDGDGGASTADAATGGSSGAGDGDAGDPSDAGDLPDAGGDAAGRQRCKRGVAYGFDPNSAPADLAALAPGVTWYYGWAPAPSPAASAAFREADVEFVPMIWGGQFDVEDAVARIPEGSRYLLGFNEPNFHAQANLTPEEAADLWPQLEEIADRRDLLLVSPAVNYCGGGCNVEDPFEWLDRFFAACDGCRVDHVAAHWYACHGDALDWYLGELGRYGRPIWLTEFSCGDEGVQPVSRQRQYMADALASLEDNPEVFRYAWFSARTDAIANVDLLAEGGERTALGDDYVTLPSAPGCPAPTD